MSVITMAMASFIVTVVMRMSVAVCLALLRLINVGSHVLMSRMIMPMSVVIVAMGVAIMRIGALPGLRCRLD